MGRNLRLCELKVKIRIEGTETGNTSNYGPFPTGAPVDKWSHSKRQ